MKSGRAQRAKRRPRQRQRVHPQAQMPHDQRVMSHSRSFNLLVALVAVHLVIYFADEVQILNMFTDLLHTLTSVAFWLDAINRR